MDAHKLDLKTKKKVSIGVFQVYNNKKKRISVFSGSNHEQITHREITNIFVGAAKVKPFFFYFSWTLTTD